MTDSAHSDLGSDEMGRLNASREWVKGHFTEEADQKYESIEGKLRLINTILSSEWVNPEETWKLQSLGVALGDAIAQRTMMQWVTVDDEFGRDPALNLPGTSIYTYPLTMISKRIERQDTIDTYSLFDAVCADIADMASSGRYK
jgi:Domain of unknown function (DUF3806)